MEKRPDSPGLPGNRLSTAASPYLRQHAQNPVDWYPWGPEALEKAKREDKPIFLSIGYAACHWCHVMERESFEDADVAAALAKGFVAIKVDREERPDLDHIYQIVVQLMGQSGGWPLSVFLTPEQRPFYAGTYFPPKPKHGMPSFREVLSAVRDAYDNRRGDVTEQADEVTGAIARVTATAAAAPGEVPVDVLAKAYLKLGKRFDDEHGGFGSRPKFPSTMAVDVLLHHAFENRSAEAEARTRRVLDAMAGGGIHDHLGGGFHRYSTDEKWLVPHFEKMLYDNAQLLALYADAGRALQSTSYLHVARATARWLLEAMSSPEGGFYATEDADSEGEEGKFFVFSPEDLEAALPDDEEAKVVARLYFGIGAGNFEDTGKTVLSEVMDIGRIAIALERGPSLVEGILDRAKAAMFAYRERRVRPARDEKILACWNGLAISGLVALAGATGHDEYLVAAKKAFTRIDRDLIDEEGRVARFTNDEGHVAKPGYLDDHANVGLAALDLHEATGNPYYLARARLVADEILTSFLDHTDGALFFAPAYAETLLCRTKDPYDSATASGAAMGAGLLFRLGARFGDPYASSAVRLLGALAGLAADNPFGLGQTVLTLDALVRGTVDIVLVGEEARITELRAALLRAYVPRRVIITVDPADPASVKAAGPLGEGKTGSGVAYVCRGQTCSLPVSSADELVALVLGRTK